ncbi:MAG: TIM barrel protein, partial [Nanoarchaeota archaeon]
EEVPASAAPYKEYVAAMRKLGVEFVAHAPFMTDKNTSSEPYKPLNVDYIWPVIPGRYEKEPVKHGDITTWAKTAPVAPMKKLITVLGELGIPILTMHVTRSGALLSDDEWARYKDYLRDLLPVAKKAGVTISVENGGTTDAQISEAIALGCKTTFDPAHYFLDMRALGKSTKDSNALTLKAFKKFCNDVAVIHLSQPSENMDAHMTTFDPKGALTCNEAILKHVQKNNGVRFITLETTPDAAAITIIHKILNG